MSTPERRPALDLEKRPRAHPVSPRAAVEASVPQRTAPRSQQVRPAEARVMLCVRVPGSLRRRLKLVAVETGKPVQELAADALEAVCRRYGG